MSIKILHWEKQKKHIRLYFVCGTRVREELDKKHRVIQDLTTILSAPQEQLVEAAKRGINQTKELEKTVIDLKLQLIEYEAKSYIEKAVKHNRYVIIKDVFYNRPISELQQLAKSIASLSNNTVTMFVNETDEKLQLVCARDKSLQQNMNQLVKRGLLSINGKGGGTDEVAQGGGEKLMSGEELLELLVQTLD